MAVTITAYNHTAKLFGNQQVTLSTLKVMLLLSHTFTATHTNMTGITGNQVSGNGWTSGGETIANVAVTTVTTNDAKLDGDDISKTASGGAIGPADGAVIYDSTGNYPLFYINLDGSHIADETAPFNITWNASGIAVWTV